MRKWETDVLLPADPTVQKSRPLCYVNHLGSTVDEKFPLRRCAAESAIYSYLNHQGPQLEDLRFTDPEKFVSGQIHEHLEQWNIIMGDARSDSNAEVKPWLEHGFNIHDYISAIQGKFLGQ